MGLMKNDKFNMLLLNEFLYNLTIKPWLGKNKFSRRLCMKELLDIITSKRTIILKKNSKIINSTIHNTENFYSIFYTRHVLEK